MSLRYSNKIGLFLTLLSCGVYLFSSIKGSPQVFSVLFLLALLVYSRFFQKLDSIPKEIKFIAYAFAGIFFTTFPNMFVNDSFSYGLRIFNMPLGYLVGAFLLVLLIGSRIILNQKIIFYMIGVACFVNGLIAVFQKVFLDIDRVGGFSGISEFGNVGSVLGLCALACFLRLNSSLKEKIFFGMAVIFAIIVMIFSETRGVILGFVVGSIALFILFILFNSNKHIRLKLLKKIIFFIVIGGVVLAFVPQVRSSMARFYQANSDIKEYKENNYNTSLGLRFEMWKEAIAIIKLSPIIGLSPKSICDRKYEINRLAKSDRDPKTLNCYGRYHNEILNTLARKGILGLLALLATWLSIGIFSIKAIQKRKGNIPAYMMMGILVYYIVSGGSGEPMSAFMDGNFFIITMVILSSLAYWGIKKGQEGCC
ncbi:O-antigen ligase family protein [Helicobacter sp. 11S03491-1]|uniref:O-antigen ligase family protein n=1 Tax=Helicobacter sp. 11S03491-1 TaxID=1476196 RepID=UPI000BA4EF8D|nr:O-antigen ligase family protein [Helicobacter sp. 11S03491-1]PAF42305.1 hypothetical protein BKH45_05020 [Helicobacter sp. 11S03491-1]